MLIIPPPFVTFCNMSFQIFSNLFCKLEFGSDSHLLVSGAIFAMLHYCAFQSLATQRVVAALVVTGSLGEMQNLWLHLGTMESEPTFLALSWLFIYMYLKSTVVEYWFIPRLNFLGQETGNH